MPSFWARPPFLEPPTAGPLCFLGGSQLSRSVLGWWHGWEGAQGKRDWCSLVPHPPMEHPVCGQPSLKGGLLGRGRGGHTAARLQGLEVPGGTAQPSHLLRSRPRL